MLRGWWNVWEHAHTLAVTVRHHVNVCPKCQRRAEIPSYLPFAVQYLSFCAKQFREIIEWLAGPFTAQCGGWKQLNARLLTRLKDSLCVCVGGVSCFILIIKLNQTYSGVIPIGLWQLKTLVDHFGGTEKWLLRQQTWPSREMETQHLTICWTLQALHYWRFHWFCVLCVNGLRKEILVLLNNLVSIY